MAQWNQRGTGKKKNIIAVIGSRTLFCNARAAHAYTAGKWLTDQRRGALAVVSQRAKPDDAGRVGLGVELLRAPDDSRVVCADRVANESVLASPRGVHAAHDSRYTHRPVGIDFSIASVIHLFDNSLLLPLVQEFLHLVNQCQFYAFGHIGPAVRSCHFFTEQDGDGF